ncbi:MAG: family 16 glycoside hydrolase, partial [Chthoniobacterales bacterium]
MAPGTAQARKSRWSSEFNEVLKTELDLVGEEVAKDADEDPNDQLSRAHKKQLVGLAFSGGGIRSATFNLGVLQALAQMRLLGEFDYLSTVSGGGYIGCWLMAWIKRRGLKDVQAALSPEWVKQPGRKEPEEIHFLRRFSNYLTPRLGWLGADTWTVIATYLRNLILNLIVLIAAMTVLLLFPRIAALAGRALWTPASHPWWVAVALFAMVFAMVVITRSLRFFRGTAADQRTPEISAEAYEKRDMIALLAGSNARLWSDDKGQPVTAPVSDAVLNSAVWFDRDFDDFVLKAKFSLEPTADAGIRIWQERTPTHEGGKTASGGHIIRLCQSRFDFSVGGATKEPRLAGAIDDRAPQRAVVLRSEGNVIEIVCQKLEITVTINGETINRHRVIGEDQPLCQRSKPGVIGLAHSKGVIFEELFVRELSSNLQVGGTQGQIQRRIVAPLFLAAFIGTFAFCFGAGANGAVAIKPWSWLRCALTTGLGVGSLLVLVRVGLVLFEWRRAKRQGKEAEKPSRRAFIFIGKEALSLGLASALGGCVALGLYHLFLGKTLWEVSVWGTPALICLSMLVLTLHIGLLGRDMRDEIREWWSRLGAWLLIYALLWVALFGTAFYATAFFDYVNGLALSVGWLASTIWGVFAAHSASSAKPQSSRTREFVAQVAPYIFIVGLFLFLSWGIDRLLPIVEGTKVVMVPSRGATFSRLLALHWEMVLASTSRHSVGLLTGMAVIVSAILSWRLDINQFSMHLLYRNRLGRCYLGASNRFRRAQPFTGFAAADDFELWELDDLIASEREEEDGETRLAPQPNEK